MRRRHLAVPPHHAPLLETLEDRLLLAAFNAGNILMAHGDTIREFTPAGQLVQQFTIPSPNENPAIANDLKVDATGRLHVTVYTEGPASSGAMRLSTYNPFANTWEHHTVAGWDKRGFRELGSFAVTNQYIYVPDSSLGIDNPGGVIRFDLNNLNNAQRLPTIFDTDALTYGLDGFIYITNHFGQLAKYNATTFQLISNYGGEISGPLGEDHFVATIAVDTNGDIYELDILGNIHRHNNAVTLLLDQIQDTEAKFGLTLSPAGTLVSGGTDVFEARIVSTDRALNPTNNITVDIEFQAGPANFVTIVPPHPGSGQSGVSVAAIDSTAAETTGSPNTGTFRITRNGSTATDLLVNFTITGTSSNGIDAVQIPSPVIIPAGSSFIDIDVTPIDDATSEFNETVILNLTVGSGYIVGTGQATVTITDNDPPLVSITATDTGAAEVGNNTGTFRIIRSGLTDDALAVVVAVTGTATNGTDYTAINSPVIIPSGAAFVDVPVSAIADGQGETFESVILTLQPDAAYTISGEAGATVNITDSSGTLITIEALDASASESGDTGTFRISRIGSTSAGLNVNILRSGTALLGGDYTQSINGTAFTSNTVFFASGVSSIDIVVTAVDDALFEAAETVGITLAPGTGYTLPALAADRFRTVTIADNEQRMASIADVTVTEGNAGTTLATFTVKLSGTTTGPVTVDFAAAAGTATEGADFTAAAGTITFLAGQTSKTITVPVVGDLIDEDDQTFFVNLLNPSGIGIADGQAVGTIKDNDNGPAISISDVTVSENDDANVEAVFLLTLSFASERSISVTAATGPAPGAANTRAVDGADFLALSPTVFTFAPGQTSIPVAVTTLFDDLAELNEKFAVNLTLPVNATIKDKQGLGTINDDDAPSVSIGDAEATEGDTGTTNAAFTVTLSHASTVPVTVKYSTTAGTAIANSDYTTQTNKTLTFAPGETSKVVNVPVKSDKRDEPDETFTVNLSAPVNATLGDAQGAGTIVDNDPTPALSVNNVTTAEGDAGTKLVTFTVKLSAASGQTVTVDYSAVDDTAEEGSDFAAAAGTLTFLPGITSQKVTVTVNGDTEAENNETFKLQLSNATNAIFDDAEGLATITSEETAPASMNDYLLAGIITSGKAPLATTGTFTFAVSADGASYTITGDGGAVADSAGTMTYTRTGKKTGRIDFIDAVRGAGVMLLTFTGTHSMAYTMTLAGGNQKGTLAGV